MMNKEDIVPILVMHNLQKKRAQYNLAESEIKDFALREGIFTRNPLIQEIMSKPDGKVPKDAKPEDIADFVSIPKPSPHPSCSPVNDSKDMQIHLTNGDIESLLTSLSEP